jgi:hypothetical protein
MDLDSMEKRFQVIEAEGGASISNRLIELLATACEWSCTTHLRSIPSPE